MADTASRADIDVSNNVTWNDAFQFGTLGDTTWSFVGMTFKLEVKASEQDVTPLMTLSTAAGSIIIDDVVNRILHLNASEAAVVAALPVGSYVYDLVMSDGSTPAIRTLLMIGHVYVNQGVTLD